MMVLAMELSEFKKNVMNILRIKFIAHSFSEVDNHVFDGLFFEHSNVNPVLFVQELPGLFEAWLTEHSVSPAKHFVVGSSFDSGSEVFSVKLA